MIAVRRAGVSLWCGNDGDVHLAQRRPVQLSMVARRGVNDLLIFLDATIFMKIGLTMKLIDVRRAVDAAFPAAYISRSISGLVNKHAMS
jgi:hypothetical protein